jgi:hypothetical protein
MFAKDGSKKIQKEKFRYYIPWAKSRCNTCDQDLLKCKNIDDVYARTGEPVFFYIGGIYEIGNRFNGLK